MEGVKLNKKQMADMSPTSRKATTSPSVEHAVIITNK
jgi:hypothetical protein